MSPRRDIAAAVRDQVGPALTAGIFGLALVQRDGVLLLAGTGLTALSGAVFTAGAGALVTVCHHLFPRLTGLI